MDPETQNNLRSRAIEWHVRLGDADDATWDAFTDWLAQDPRHREAYDAIEAIDLAIEPLLPKLRFPDAVHDASEGIDSVRPRLTFPDAAPGAPNTLDSLSQNLTHPDAAPDASEAVNPLPPKLTLPNTAPEKVFTATRRQSSPQVSAPRPRAVPPRWQWLAGTALAASVAAVIALLPHLSSTRYEVTTRPGQQQTIALDADTQVILNGSTHATFDRNNPRFAALESGEALFRVHHDPTHPFTLEIGNTRIQDVGTVFNVVRDPTQLRLTVAEGKVLYQAPTQSIPLDAGQLLLAAAESGSARVTTIPIASVGAWQQGRLVYSGEPLSQVAADLGRSLGVHIDVSPTLQNRPFSGAIVLTSGAPDQIERLKMALNVDLEAAPNGWTLKPVDDARH